MSKDSITRHIPVQPAPARQFRVVSAIHFPATDGTEVVLEPGTIITIEPDMPVSILGEVASGALEDLSAAVEVSGDDEA